MKKRLLTLIAIMFAAISIQAQDATFSASTVRWSSSGQGTIYRVTLNMTSKIPIVGYQMNIRLPERTKIVNIYFETKNSDVKTKLGTAYSPQ